MVANDSHHGPFSVPGGNFGADAQEPSPDDSPLCSDSGGLRELEAAHYTFGAAPEEPWSLRVLRANLIKVVDINRATLEIYEADSKEQLLRSIASTFSPESYPAFKEAIIALAEGQTWFETETITTTLTGKKNHILLRLRVLPGLRMLATKSGFHSGHYGKQRAAEALQTQTRVLESMAEGVVMTGEDERIMFTNPAFAPCSAISRGN